MQENFPDLQNVYLWYCDASHPVLTGRGNPEPIRLLLAVRNTVRLVLAGHERHSFAAREPVRLFLAGSGHEHHFFFDECDLVRLVLAGRERRSFAACDPVRLVLAGHERHSFSACDLARLFWLDTNVTESLMDATFLV